MKKLSIFIISLTFLLTPALSFGQNAPTPITNPNDPGFKLIVCDGPPNMPEAAMKAWREKNGNKTYIPCDFNGAMLQIQHLINVALVLGVIAAMVGFAWAGYLFITGVPDKRNQAKDIFAKAIWGLVIMLTAWFMVFQLIKWLVPEDSSVTNLINNEQNQ